MRVTQRQIAEHLGLSHQAVNFALGSRPHEVSAETRRRVLAAARELGYRGNSAAKAISTGRFDAMGLVLGESSNLSSVQGGVLHGIYEVLEAKGMHLTLTIASDEHLADEEWMPKLLSREMVDGLLLNYTHSIPANLKKVIQRHRIPAVWLNTKRKYNAVYLDDKDAAYRATKKFIASGYKRIIYSDIARSLEDAEEWHYSHDEREKGYLQAMREAKLKPVIFAPSPCSVADILNGIRKVTPRSSRPIAMLGYGFDHRFWMNAAMAQGLVVGRDLVMISFKEWSEFGNLESGSLRLPERDLGREAAKMLLRLLKTGRSQPSKALQIPLLPGKVPLPKRTSK